MMMTQGRLARVALIAVLGVAGVVTYGSITAQSPPKTPAATTIKEADMKEFLTYLSSDELMGREVFTEGYGVAAQYVADELRAWGVKPIGDHGTYFQIVKLNDVKTVSDRSTITVEVNGQSKTFKNGEGVRFTTPVGGKETLTLAGAEFLGYGLNAPTKDDYAGKSVKGKAVVWVGLQPPNAQTYGTRLLNGRSAHAVEEAGAVASICYDPALLCHPPQAARGGGGAQPAAVAPAQGAGMLGRIGIATAIQGDLQTVQDLSRPWAPQIAAGDEFFAFLLSAAPTTLAAMKDLMTAQKDLPAFAISGVKLTINVDATYQVLQTLYTRNVVGMVEGTDPQLKSTYVMFGAHLDHLGYRPAAGGGARSGPSTAPGTVPGQVDNSANPNLVAGTGAAPAALPDVINNGADDDGSGTTGEMGIAKAFATGPKPKRSVIFVWHAGEEKGLYGSKYNADFPVVPLDKVVAQLNIDMIGRDRNNDPAYSNTVFVIGADRISTDLHNVIVDTDAKLASPVKLDYEYNDPTDSNGFYFRSDHYSYAAKGIPIAFFFTGTHPDYHRVTDSVEKIHFDKLTHIAQLVYQAGFTIADSTKAPERDNKGPRSGKGFQGKIK